MVSVATVVIEASCSRAATGELWPCSMDCLIVMPEPVTGGQGPSQLQYTGTLTTYRKFCRCGINCKQLLNETVIQIVYTNACKTKYAENMSTIDKAKPIKLTFDPNPNPNLYTDNKAIECYTIVLLPPASTPCLCCAHQRRRWAASWLWWILEEEDHMPRGGEWKAEGDKRIMSTSTLQPLGP